MSDRFIIHGSRPIQIGPLTFLRTSTFSWMQTRRNMDIIHLTEQKSILALKIGSLYFARTNFIQVGASASQTAYNNTTEIALKGKYAHIKYKTFQRTQRWTHNQITWITSVQTRALNIGLLLASQFIGKK